MKFIIATALIGGMFCITPTFSQNVQQGQSQTLEEPVLPKYTVTGDEFKDKARFNIEVVEYYAKYYAFPQASLNQEDISDLQKNRLLEQWNKENPDQSEALKVKNIESYKKLVFDYKLSSYPPKPELIHTGDQRADELNYKLAMEAWSESHPDYPKYQETGDLQKDSNNYRLAKLAFYDKYIKED